MIFELIKKHLMNKNINKDIESDKIKLTEIDDKIQIEILEKCSIVEYQEFIDKSNYNIQIPIRLFQQSNLILLKQTITIFSKELDNYIISQSESSLIISQFENNKNEMEETELKIDKYNKKYKVTKYIHDLTYNTKEVKFYPFDMENEFNLFCLERIDAIKLLYRLIDKLNSINNINKIIDIYRICDITNLVFPKDYYPVISNELLTLSWRCRFDKEDINNEKYTNFDIILNETREKIGNISFDYCCASGFTYGGNVSYYIKEGFRNKKYASYALSLLKKLLINNYFTGDKDLYISILPNNIYSQKVAEYNGGEIIYSGSVPADDSLNYIDGVKDVVVYKIKLK